MIGGGQALSICPMQAATAAANEKDGQFPLQVDLTGLTVTEIVSFLIIGREAATSGRLRDAETAFLMSCRVTDKFKGAASVDSADAKFQLGGHYEKVAANAGSGADANRVELLWRAQLLYSDSLNTYIAKIGRTDDKTHLAAQGLAAVQQSLAQMQPLAFSTVANSSAQRSSIETDMSAEAPPEGPANISPPSTSKQQPRKADFTKTVPAFKSVLKSATRTGPSFNCARAGSVPEKLICSDPELAQLDQELFRIYARAKNATSDHAAFRRRQDQEWLKRESACRDRRCLLAWYSERREQLMRDIEGRSQSEGSALR